MEDAMHEDEYDDDDDLPAISIGDSSSSAWTVSEAAESAYSRRTAGSSRSIGLPGTEHSRRQGDSPSRLGYKADAALIADIADSVVIRESLAPEFLVLLKGLHDQLPVTLRGFISKYLDAALIAPKSDRCKVLYKEIMSDITCIVACPFNTLSETDVISASAWLICACASMRVGVNGMQAVQCLLNEIATTEQIMELCGCIQRSGWDSAQLVRASAALGDGLAAAVLLRAAAAAALGCHVSHAAPASVEELTEWVSADTSLIAVEEGGVGNNGGGNSGGDNSGGDNSGATNSGVDNSCANISGATISGATNSGDDNSCATNSGGDNSCAPNSGGDNSCATNSGVDNGCATNSGATKSGGDNNGANNSCATNSGGGDAWQVAAVLVAGRVLAHCAATDQQREALVAAFTRKCRARGPDAHKVALGVSRLKLILRR